MTIRVPLILTCGLASLLFLFSAAASARTQPVYDIVDKPIRSGSGRTLEMAQIAEVLANAARTKGWSVAAVEPGYLRAQIHVRQHFAAIDLRYTPESYSITYRDSDVLMYDGKKIHRNYNKWIKLIEQLVDDGFAVL